MRGYSGGYFTCHAPGEAVEIVVVESGGGSFVKGRPVEVSATLSAYDASYGSWVNDTSVQVLKLR